MMKKLFTLLFVLSSSLIVFAQQYYQDVVYLKNGSIIRGTIIEQIPNRSIKIETADKSVFVYQFNEIAKFSKEALARGRRKYSNSSSSKHESGYVGVVDVGYAVGVGDYGLNFINLTMINGYKFNPYFSLGFGTGTRLYYDSDAILTPFFLNFQVNFIDSPIYPFFALSTGYSFDLSDDFEATGFLVNLNVGVHFEVSDKFGINVGIGYEGQWAEFYDYDYSYNYYGYYNYYTDPVSKAISGISFKVGFVL
jgi:hypothetical protein